jgi:hypothetical protein
MSEDPEERRKKDLRDLEFYRQRLRPTIADLWRTIENSGENRVIIASAPRRKSPDSPKRPSKTLAYLVGLVTGREAEKGASGARNGNPATARANQTDVMWPLVAALIVLLILGGTDMIARVPLALPL